MSRSTLVKKEKRSDLCNCSVLARNLPISSSLPVEKYLRHMILKTGFLRPSEKVRVLLKVLSIFRDFLFPITKYLQLPYKSLFSVTTLVRDPLPLEMWIKQVLDIYWKIFIVMFSYLCREFQLSFKSIPFLFANSYAMKSTFNFVSHFDVHWNFFCQIRQSIIL